MANKKGSQRIYDPIHGVIEFDFGDELEVDEVAWELLQTPEFQRLRRIKQLGLSDFVFPGATHSRFAHSVGVFHNARRLVEVIHKEKIKKGKTPDKKKAKLAILAALLHDVGHGPFSHCFESTCKKVAKNSDFQFQTHEWFTAEIIKKPLGGIFKTLKVHKITEKDMNMIADFISPKPPEDIYGSIVSGSFDADRLDFLVRDRYMTGVGTGAIDLDWLMNNIEIASISLASSDDKDIPTDGLCFSYKARDTLEDFLLARYRLYTNVYYHKTTRGMEEILSALLREIAIKIRETDKKSEILDLLGKNHPLVLFFEGKGDMLENYFLLDDSVIWGVIHSIFNKSMEKNRAQSRNISSHIDKLASRLIKRERLYYIDVNQRFPTSKPKRQAIRAELKNAFKSKLDKTVFYSKSPLSTYGQSEEETTPSHKHIKILAKDGKYPQNIVDTEGNIIAGLKQKLFDRFYFSNKKDYEEAENIIANLQ